MLKFLLIFFLIFYLVVKVGGFIMKALFSGFSNNHQAFQKGQNTQRRRPPGGNVNIDYVPGSDRNKSQRKDFKGGDYVDYEEV